MKPIKVHYKLPFQNFKQGRIIGIRYIESMGLVYTLEPLRVNFGQFKNGAKLIYFSLRDIINKEIVLCVH
jgi:hypothetical protein